MVASSRVAGSPVGLPDPADDWSGDEPAVARAARRAEFWPQLFSTTERALLIVWGVVLAILLFVELLVSWTVVLSPDRELEGLWGVSWGLTAAGAWLAFRIAGDLDVELEENPGPALG